jgi:hypothetical protein
VNPSLIAQFRKYLIAAAGYVAALLAYGLIAPTASIVPMPLGHPDAIKAALTVSDEKHPRGAGGKFVSKQEGTTA